MDRNLFLNSRFSHYTSLCHLQRAVVPSIPSQLDRMLLKDIQTAFHIRSRQTSTFIDDMTIEYEAPKYYSFDI